MANLKNINIMSKAAFDNVGETAFDELYAVEFGRIPDYTAGISVAANTTYTIPARGVVVMTVSHADTAANNIIVNGVTLFSSTQGEKYGDGTLPASGYLVGKGYTVQSIRALKYYPTR